MTFFRKNFIGRGPMPGSETLGGHWNLVGGEERDGETCPNGRRARKAGGGSP